MSQKSILENSNLANNINPNCYNLLSQNWWPQVDNTIFHPISNNSSLSSCNTTRSSSCEDQDVISISNNNGNSATNNSNLHQYQFLLGVHDDENINSSLINGETPHASNDHNHLIWSQLLLFKTLNLGEHKKMHGLQPSLTKSRGTISTCNTLKRNNGRAQEYQSDGKKRKLEDNLETNSKRQKNEFSSTTIQVPKMRLGDKITALQQIVSPFGKTDTASVLWETINYVRFLQGQIQLLSHAYMKSNTCKERYWGGFEKNEVDLRSKGLCLFPISFTPQIYHENNNGSDYLIPSYRGCLYR
ncbi:transcription factor bHLH111 isoform X2 [Capsicum annuum]|uniref:transcription factor bHLH111 isoform X2 n=1 Tax=Capsicum annuum TaxID=4072 RepID=UPI001FB0F7FE|nr:transcription factor bHLH111 isoform X2 [Capsicum annuum]